MTGIPREKAIKYFEDMKKGIFLFNGNWLFDMAIEALKQESCEDAISRKSIKQKLQEHHDFFVNAYGGFSNLSQNDKSRVDEITNCIAMVINEPPVTLTRPTCKDCKWKSRNMDFRNLKCPWGERVEMIDNDFCSRYERK